MIRAIAAVGFGLVGGITALTSGDQPAGPPQAAPICNAVELKTTFGRWFEPGAQIKSGMDPAELTAGLLGYEVAALRLHLIVRAAGSGRWKLALRDNDQRLLALIDASDFGSGGKPVLGASIWTGRLDRPLVTAQIIGGEGVVVEAVEGVALPRNLQGDSELFSLRGALPTWVPLYKANDDGQQRMGAVVGILHTGDVPPDSAAAGDFEPQSWCCSGVMISDDLMLTNHHCGSFAGTSHGWSAKQCQRTVFDLGWEDEGVRRQFACKEVIAQDQRLDYAVLRVAPVRGSEGARGGSLSARLAQVPAVPNTPIYVVHHAECNRKLVSAQCGIRDVRSSWKDLTGTGPKTEFGHDCDSEQGASGAPVFNLKGELIGLHHLGYKQCSRGDKLNSAVSAQVIAAHLKQARPAIAKELGW